MPTKIVLENHTKELAEPRGEFGTDDVRYQSVVREESLVSQSNLLCVRKEGGKLKLKCDGRDPLSSQTLFRETILDINPFTDIFKIKLQWQIYTLVVENEELKLVTDEERKKLISEVTPGADIFYRKSNPEFPGALTLQTADRMYITSRVDSEDLILLKDFNRGSLFARLQE